MIRAAIYENDMDEAVELWDDNIRIAGAPRVLEYAIRRGNPDNIIRFIGKFRFAKGRVLETLYNKAPLELINKIFEKVDFSQKDLDIFGRARNELTAEKALDLVSRIKSPEDRCKVLQDIIRGSSFSPRMTDNNIESLLTAVEKSELFSKKGKSVAFKKAFNLAFHHESEICIRILHNHPLIKPEDFAHNMYDYILENGLHTPFTQWLLTSAGHQDLLEIRKHATGRQARQTLEKTSMTALEVGGQNDEFLKVIDEAISGTDPKKVRFSTLGPKVGAVKEVLAVPNMEIPTVIIEMICSYATEDMEVWKPDDTSISDIQNELNDCVWDQSQAQRHGLKQEEVEIGREIERLECVEQQLLQKKLRKLTDEMEKFEVGMDRLEHGNDPVQAGKKGADEVSMGERMGVVEERLWIVRTVQRNLNRFEERRERRLNRIARYKREQMGEQILKLEQRLSRIKQRREQEQDTPSGRTKHARGGTSPKRRTRQPPRHEPERAARGRNDGREREYARRRYEPTEERVYSGREEERHRRVERAQRYEPSRERRESSKRHEPREDYEYDRGRRDSYDEFEEDYAPIRRERPERKERKELRMR